MFVSVQGLVAGSAGVNVRVTGSLLEPARVLTSLTVIARAHNSLTVSGALPPDVACGVPRQGFFSGQAMNSGPVRPLISVVIPTFNWREYLPATRIRRNGPQFGSGRCASQAHRAESLGWR